MGEDVPHECFKPGFWCPVLWPPLKADQLDPSTLLPALPCFPLHDFRPRTLVDCIVDRDDDLHVGRLRVVVLACHSIEELRL